MRPWRNLRKCSVSDVLNLKNRHQTIKSLDSVMSAMLIITAAKTQKAKIKFQNAQKYSDSIKELAMQICAIEGEKEESKDNLVVAITTNKGLCGNFNDKVINKIVGYRKHNEGNYGVYALGRNARRLARNGFDIVVEDAEIIQRPDSEKVSTLAGELLKWYKITNGNLLIAYNEYKSIMVQNPVVKKILPIYGMPVDKFIIEPNAPEIRDAMMLHYIINNVFMVVAILELVLDLLQQVSLNLHQMEMVLLSAPLELLH